MAPAAELDPTHLAPSLLHIDGLVVDFGSFRALDGVGLHIEPGELVAIAGENGAGKSTLVRCIAGDLAPSAGRITSGGGLLDGGRRAPASAGIAVVWQNPELCDNLDIATNVLLGSERRWLLLPDSRWHAKAAALLAAAGERWFTRWSAASSSR